MMGRLNSAWAAFLVVWNEDGVFTDLTESLQSCHLGKGADGRMN